MQFVKQWVPWQARFWTKFTLAQMGINYRALRALGMTRHGSADEPQAALETFRRHAAAAGFPRNNQPFSVLELGPGDALNTAPIAAALGASRIHLVDAAPDARTAPALYRTMIDYLQSQNLDVSRIEQFDDLDGLLRNCNATYHTGGLASLEQIPDRSVDFVLSNAVLQHIRRHELPDTLQQLRRIMKQDAVASHSIGIWDQMGFALNHLRFSKRFWESPAVARSGCYTNRVRFSQMIRLFQAAGFHVDITEVNRWPALPTPRRRLDPMFHRFNDDDLRVFSYNVTLRPSNRKRAGQMRILTPDAPPSLHRLLLRPAAADAGLYATLPSRS